MGLIQNVFDESPAGADQGQRDEEEGPFEPGRHIGTYSGKRSDIKKTKTKKQTTLQIPEMYSQVSDVVHDGPALNRMPLGVDKVVVDLMRRKESGVSYTDKDSRHHKQRRQNKQASQYKSNKKYEIYYMVSVATVNSHYGKPTTWTW